jgi:hypothetical protein
MKLDMCSMVSFNRVMRFYEVKYVKYCVGLFYEV